MGREVGDTMLKFMNGGKTIMLEHDDGQLEIIGEEQKEAFEEAKRKLLKEEGEKDKEKGETQ
jgi:hypothetical protein